MAEGTQCRTPLADTQRAAGATKAASKNKRSETSAAAEARLGLGVGLGRLGRGAPVYFLA